MTEQISDKLIYEGEPYLMRPFPLQRYFELNGNAPPFLAYATSCWRGYCGHWTIEDGQLWFDGLEGHIAEPPLLDIAGRAFAYSIDYEDRSLCRAATLNDIFPDHSGRVFANWFTGTVDVVQWNPADPFYRGARLEIDLVRGVVTDSRPTMGGTRPVPVPTRMGLRDALIEGRRN